MRKFMRTRGRDTSSDAAVRSRLAQRPPTLSNAAGDNTNGHLKTAAAAADELLSTGSSRYWSGSEGSRGREVLGVPGALGVLGVPRGGLWEDAEFPASWRSLGDKKFASGVVWVRPHELCARPTFLGDDSDWAVAERWGCAGGAGGAGGAGAGGAGGGPLADTHVRVAGAALAHTPQLLGRVTPAHSFTRQYTGAFTFRFWVFGTWRDVLVDDRLPARGARLLCADPTPPGDFALPLLEKAYAKLYGSYVALRAGSVSRALQDLTGGIVQSFALSAQPRVLTAQVLHSAVPRSTLLVAVVPPEKGGAVRSLRNGLRSGCAYCVAGLARVRAGAGAERDVLLVRVRAGAAAAEWSGAWSGTSAEWRALPAADRDLLAGSTQDLGYFWMSLSELRASCAALVLVHVGPDDWMREPALRDRTPWRAVLARRRWRRGYNAGGPPRAPTAGTNPQFHLRIPGAGKCHALVALAQRYTVGAGVGAERTHAIGFAVYALGAGAGPRRPAHDSLRGLRALDVTHESRAREVVTFFTLPGGEYLVVPHTRRPHTDTSFLLRIFTDNHAHVWEVNDDNVIIEDIWRDGGDALSECGAGEVDAERLRRAAGAPGLEVCRALVALRAGGGVPGVLGVLGAVGAGEAAALVALAGRWRAAFSAHASCGSVCSYRVRALLRAAGVSVSNKVLECVVVRFARRARFTADAFLLAMARLHLAHERHRSLETKLKSNPLSLEEMILMTVYT